MSSASAGRILLIPKGDYSASTQYSALDVVVYNHDSYVAKASTKGNLPTNTTYWQPLTNGYGEIASLKETFTNEVVTRSQLGAHNLLYIAQGTYSSSSGVNAEVNADGIVTSSGAPSANSALILGSLELKAGKEYFLSGCPSGGSSSSYRISVYPEDSTSTTIANDYGDGATVTVSTDGTYRVGIRIAKNYDSTGLVFYPMIRLATDTDDTFQPYAKTNQQLAKETRGLIDNVNVCGVHNLNGTKYSYAPSYEHNGITYTLNDDGTITATGTNTGSSSSYAASSPFNFTAPFSAQVILRNEMEGITDYNVHCYPWLSSEAARPYTDSTKTTRVDGNTNAYGTKEISFWMEEGQQYRICCRVSSGYTSALNNVKFKPLLRLASDPDTTFKPYAMTNKQLTDVAELIKGCLVLDNSLKRNTSMFSVTGDGVKDYKTLMNELSAAFWNYCENQNSNEFLLIDGLNINSVEFSPVGDTFNRYWSNATSHRALMFERIGYSNNDNSLVARYFMIASNASDTKCYYQAINSATPIDITTQILNSGQKMYLVVTRFKLIS